MPTAVRRAAVALAIAAAAVALAVSRPWPGPHGNRVVVTPEGGGPGWDVYLDDRATPEQAEKVSHLLSKEVRLVPGPNGLAVLERRPDGTLVVSLLFDPDEVRVPHAAATARRVLRGLDELFPHKAVAAQVCRGPRGIRAAVRRASRVGRDRPAGCEAPH